jgi:predicted lysophospholipase L1 biosynthesis ABC-type transport system permease subunit
MSMWPMWTKNWRSAGTDSSTPPVFRWQRSLTRLAVWWAIAFAVSLIVALAGAGIILWTVSHDQKSLAVMSLGITLVFVGLGAIVACLGAWVASRGHHRPESEL